MFASQGAKGFSATLDITSSRIIIIYTPAIATKSKSFSFLRNLSISSSQLTRKSQIRGTATLSSILFCCTSSAINQWNVKCRTQNEALFLGGKRPFHLNWKFSGMTNRKFWLNGKRSSWHAIWKVIITTPTSNFIFVGTLTFFNNVSHTRFLVPAGEPFSPPIIYSQLSFNGHLYTWCWFLPIFSHFTVTVI